MAAIPARQQIWRRQARAIACGLLVLLLLLPALTATPSGVDTHGWRRFWPSARAALQAHFGGKAQLRSAWLRLQESLFAQVRLTPLVYQGAPGWLFYRDLASRRSILGAPRFSDAELQAWRTALLERQAALQVHGGHLVLLLPSDKHQIYPEMARLATPSPTHGRAAQLTAALRDTAVTVVPTRAALLQARQTHLVYYRQDTHWNRLGAFVAYRALAAALQQFYPALQPIAWQATCSAVEQQRVGDLAHLGGVATLLHEDAPSLHLCLPPQARLQRFNDASATPPLQLQQGDVSSTNPHGSIPRLMMFHDSFGIDVIHPWLAEHVQTGFYRNTPIFDDARIAAQQPAVVILEIAERYLYEHPPPVPLSQQHGVVYAQGFEPPEVRHGTQVRAMRRRGTIKLRHPVEVEALQIDVEGGSYRVQLDGAPLGHIDARQGRRRWQHRLASDSLSQQAWHELTLEAERTSQPLSQAEVHDARQIAGFFFAVNWH